MKNNYSLSNEKATKLRKINKKRTDNSEEFTNIPYEMVRSNSIHHTKNITKVITGTTLLVATIRENENINATITNSHFSRKKNDAK